MLKIFRKQPKFELDEFLSLLDNDSTGEEAFRYFYKFEQAKLCAMLEKINPTHYVYFDAFIEKGIKSTIDLFQRKQDYSPDNIKGGVYKKVKFLYFTELEKIRNQEKRHGYRQADVNIEAIENTSETKEYQDIRIEIKKLVEMTFVQLAENCTNSKRRACLCQELLHKIEFKINISKRQTKQIDLVTPEGRLIEIRNTLTAFKNIEQAEKDNFKFTYTRFKEVYGHNTPNNETVDTWLRQRVHRCYDDFVNIYNELKKIKKDD